MFTEKYSKREDNLSLEVLHNMNKMFLATTVKDNLVPAGAESGSCASLPERSFVMDTPEVVEQPCAAAAMVTTEEAALVEEEEPEERFIVILQYQDDRRMVPAYSLRNLRVLAEDMFQGDGRATLFLQDMIIDPLLTLRDIVQMEPPRPTIESKRLGSEAIIVDASLISEIKKEDILKKEICDILCSDSWQKEITHIFIDEAHCVVQWGHEFRPDYMKISKLRSVFPGAKFVALTATATKLTIKEITDILQMKSFTTISACVDRPNVQITVIKRLPSAGGKNTAEESFKQVMESVVRSLCNDAENFPKAIMYSKLKWCGNGYNMVCQEAAKESDPNAVIHRVSQYHSACTDQMKKIIVDDMAKVNGNISLLFATEAYGMGADAPNIRRIIHYGPPTSIETYMQEIGRAGRDGLQSEAVLYFNNNDLGSNTPVRDEVKQFCRLKSCRKQFLCEHFDWECVASLIKHNCCDICKIDCNCIDCLSNSAFDDIGIAEDDIEGTPSQLQSLLAAYF
ncbi:recQ [Mytilus coruscus]|uniref:DNA 3'-5' helicase n=1 Tax=Mytilus coruscus TaxID=42192 RepID=A0A6J8DCT4_MYTCO|nr:recQ [Mytilus coruscus]